MKKIGVLMVCLSLWLSGCMITPISPTLELGKNYKLRETCTIDTGSIMIDIFNVYAYPAYKAKYNYQPFLIPEIKSGQKWKATFFYNDDCVISCNSNNTKYGIRIKPNGELASKKPLVLLYSPVALVGGQSVWNLPEPQLFEQTEEGIIEANANSFKAELIYTGKMGNIITVSYREFVDNMARPAFYQELNYDLSEGNDISFKSLKIKVLEATNSKISFQVIDDGGLPWVPVKNSTPYITKKDEPIRSNKTGIIGYLLGF